MSVMFENSPIAAICTAPGPSGIAVVRLSGCDVFAIADRLCGNSKIKPSNMHAGTFKYIVLRDSDDGSLIDEAIVLVFKAPNSYTGDDTVEFQTHGGRIPVQKVMRCLINSGARSATAGEFTRRAFLNGRIDLSRAEAVMDIIKAQSERAGRIAAEQLTGALGNRLDLLYMNLMEICADMEASLDFADDEMSGILAPSNITERLDNITKELSGIMESWREGVLLREGALVVLNGIPNSGKSTLFNALLGMFRSIVTDIPGTTRDSIEETVLIEGIPLRIVDTAGIRESFCEIEQIGIERAISLAKHADIVLRIIDISSDVNQFDWMNGDVDSDKVIIVLNKSDIPQSDDKILEIIALLPDYYDVVAVSAAKHIGLDELKNKMAKKLLREINKTQEHNVSISERHRNLIANAVECMNEASKIFAENAESGAVYCAQYLRSGAEFLGEITGKVYSEDILDTIFSRFCIGK